MADWATEEVNSKIRDLVSQGVSCPQIAKVLWTEKRIRVTRNMVIRRARTLKLNLRINNARGIFAPLTPVEIVPVRGSREADDLFRVDWERGCAAKALGGRWDIPTHSVRDWCKKLKLTPRGVLPGWVPPIIEVHVPVWTDERRLMIAAEYPTAANPELAKKLSELPGPVVTRNAVMSYAKRNKLHKIIVIRATGRMPRGAKPVVAREAIEAPPVLKITPKPQMSRTAGGRSPSGMAQASVSSFGWSIGALPKPPSHRPGECRWPLTCGEPLAGKHWCDGHAAMLGKRAARHELMAAE